MRLFLGIDLPEEIKKQLFHDIDKLRTHHPAFRWIEPKNYHITVQFFGEVSNPELVTKRLKDILYDAESFYMTSLNLETVADKKILLYLNFYRQKKLEKIVKKIEEDLGEDKNREYMPHISLSRSSLSSKQQYYALQREIGMMDINIEFEVKKLTLFESNIAGKTPVYTKISEFKLL
ncbi:MAG: RNA 2',3'-cyclic phosphodiesterase [Patescibacteria group bacterium]